MNFKPIFQKFTLSVEEEKFLTEAQTATTADMNQSQVAANLYFAKTLEDVADKIIELNTKVEIANQRNSLVIVWLTAGIFLSGVAGIIVALNNTDMLYGYLGFMTLVIIGLGIYTYKNKRG